MAYANDEYEKMKRKSGETSEDALLKRLAKIKDIDPGITKLPFKAKKMPDPDPGMSKMPFSTALPKGMKKNFDNMPTVDQVLKKKKGPPN